MFFDVVLPMFLFHSVAWFCPKLPEKVFVCQVRFLETFLGAYFWLLAFVSGWCFLVLFCRCFSCQVRVLEEIFKNKFLFFCLCVRLVFCDVVLPMFQFHYVALFSRKLPDKIIFLSGARFGRNFRERTFGILPWCPVGGFWCRFAYVSVLLCCLALPKAA